jgi:hypothetical protein
VDSIVAFFGVEGGVMKPGNMSIERQFKTFQDLGAYGLEDRMRVTVKEWNAMLAYIEATANFWEKK